MEKMNFSTPIVLENDNVLLRPLEPTDVDHLLPFALNEPEIFKFSHPSPAGSPQALGQYIQSALQERNAKTGYPFIVFDKRSNEYAGCTRFYDISFSNQSLQLGYTWYASKFCGTGLNKNCKLLLLDYAFGILGMHRVEFRAHAQNERSIAAMKSIGCVAEGILRSHIPGPGGKRRDTIILSILRTDWESGVRENLINKIEYGSISKKRY